MYDCASLWHGLVALMPFSFIVLDKHERSCTFAAAAAATVTGADLRPEANSVSVQNVSLPGPFLHRRYPALLINELKLIVRWLTLVQLVRLQTQRARNADQLRNLAVAC